MNESREKIASLEEKLATVPPEVQAVWRRVMRGEVSYTRAKETLGEKNFSWVNDLGTLKTELDRSGIPLPAMKPRGPQPAPASAKAEDPKPSKKGKGLLSRIRGE